ncbi:MAG: MATE family efflux transporter [Lachnospiraceae bacterium]|nr:MATE family efflux transporter [Lachnospiraceae bacterium]MDD3616077.1 MATE family efflux transporter [Lachnospiraceae bacterium]
MDTANLDLQKMSTNKNLFRMSIPIFVELLLQLLVGNIDQIMVSQYSQASVAAIVNGNQIMSLIIIVLNMICMATTVILSQYLGSKDDKSASRTCMISLCMITIICLVITAVALIGEKAIFTSMHVQEEIFAETCTYFAIVAVFVLVQGLYLNFAAILRTYTFMKEVMYVSIIMNVLNICGNAVLINGLLGAPRLGIIGAAISTVFSKTVGLILMIWLFKKKVSLPLGIEYLRPFSMGIFKKLCKLAFPSGLESFSYNLSQMCILSIINVYGTMVTATKGYCSTLSNFSYVYAIALAQATQIVLGYLLGAKQSEAIEKRVWSTLKIAFIVCESLTLVLFLSNDLVMRVFTSDPAVLALSKRIFFLEFLLEFGRAINICMTRALISVGDIKTPIIFGISGHWLLAFLLSYIFGSVLGWGLEGVWLAMGLDETIRGLIYVFRFRQQKWKKQFQPAS